MSHTARKLERSSHWLHDVRLFSDIKDNYDAMDHIATLMTKKVYPAGAAIINEGEEGQEAFFLRAGTIKVFKSMADKQRFPVAALSAADHPFFGEAALLQADKRSATILCESECECLVLDKRSFDAFCRDKPDWALPIVLRIARVVLDRLHKTNDDMILLYRALVNEVKGY